MTIVSESEPQPEPLSTLDSIIDQYPDEEFLKADGLDNAVIGVCTKSMRLIYSVSKCIDILAEDMGHEDAAEFFWYNTEGAYVGDKTPIWCDDNL